ncbi:hypothetical protein KR51_00032500 [Rubidibacter lacunae KORDI 51-2]|uniref:Uncharacterized protein n=1 Tax=Rubidibacter lacunae KORDI 51-2 TaxID=582515 RepID=U5DI77_9CHRO|nr:hypothetical protein KR51_00032500 [Rubidibacter lacunae KORDI 51-2]
MYTRPEGKQKGKTLLGWQSRPAKSCRSEFPQALALGYGVNYILAHLPIGFPPRCPQIRNLSDLTGSQGGVDRCNGVLLVANEGFNLLMPSTLQAIAALPMPAKNSTERSRELTGENNFMYLGFAEKVHKTNLGGRELMESGFYHLAPAFCLGFSAQVQGF